MDQESLIKEAVRMYEIRHYESALPIFRKFAKKGDRVALCYLGKMAFFGQGMKKDPSLAYDSFYKAAIELDIEAVYMVGRCLEEGYGIGQNLEKAFEYYSASSVRGSVEGQLKEALCYEEGVGVPQNEQKALTIFVELSKKFNHPYATFRIGMAYLNGQGVQKSPENAFSWLNKALLLGSTDAMNQFRLIGTKSKKDDRTLSNIETIGIDLFNGDRPKDAIIYLQIAANEGSIKALQLLEIAYHEGKGVPKASKTAFDYALKGAQANDPEAMFCLGKKYELGDGVPSSFTKAAFWYELASDKNLSEAKINLKGIRGY
ncbi:MAG: tetratricopeptide repeat protein [Candidatus Izemoplasmatales bacterium]|jgi:TPR repeat protein|nr:tetratricopeptide repeat protein [Candidatus Izemoplasmatales bacterium]